ncbi:6-phosphogluconolactonase [Nocardia rhizosphaerihabitans]|uniref:6-phosphogluconolactonase n=1 Tax=Nocardia rhizosphaerihabitans TaxID=1691570 RepID=A0ABQ2K6U4_9NOCA|nr:6-phosphogluconolactonase [Nocardia rhizosphaerihabitans]GGN68791.1 6-phosphogluconolactonase [Nocardia rhizosphaerihabitans]
MSDHIDVHDELGAEFPANTVEVHDDADGLADAAAERFVDVIVAAQAERGTASVSLTGGSDGIRLLERVRQNPGAIDWSKLYVYWGDERFVPADDPDRNELQARKALLDFVPLDPAHVFPIAPSDGTYGSPEAAAAAYAQAIHTELDERGEIDLTVLGMGPEGHIDSLFPHSPAIREQHDYVVAVHDCPKPPPTRVSLTLPAIHRSRHVMLVVSGTAKAAAVAAAVNGASPDDVPSAGAVGIESTTWVVDEAAAADLLLDEE